jgi:hypothetical protein
LLLLLLLLLLRLLLLLLLLLQILSDGALVPSACHRRAVHMPRSMLWVMGNGW